MNRVSQLLRAGQQADWRSIPGYCGDSTVRYRVGTDSPHKKTQGTFLMKTNQLHWSKHKMYP